MTSIARTSMSEILSNSPATAEGSMMPMPASFCQWPSSSFVPSGKVGQRRLTAIDGKVLVGVIARPIDDSNAAARPNAAAGEAEEIKWSNEL